MAVPTSTSWRNGLFGQVCGGSCGTCLGAWFCTPCLHGRVSSRADHYPDTSESTLTTFNSDCGIAYLLGCCGLTFVPIMMKRTEVREKFGIDGSAAEDCLLSCFCQPCALAQMSTELKDRSSTTALLPTDNKVGYVSPAAATGGMVYSDTKPLPVEESKPAFAAPVYTDAPPQQTAGVTGVPVAK